ncbi:MAG: hypothetical protein ACJ8OJ_03380 [Povalibacter sp.]|jgi:hypothetical protein
MFVGPGSQPGLTVMLIAAPSDGVVFDYFRSLASRWQSQVTGERLTIDGDIPLRANLCSPEITKPVQKLIAADFQILSRIELEFGGLKVTYVRSGGHGPTMYRSSFFDEIRIELTTDGNELIAQAAMKAACRTFDVQGIRSDLTLQEFTRQNEPPSASEPSSTYSEADKQN